MRIAFKQSGVTLIEWALSMLIVGICPAGFFAVITLNLRHSSKPLITLQAITVARSYLDQALVETNTLAATHQAVLSFLANLPEFKIGQGDTNSEWNRFQVDLNVRHLCGSGSACLLCG